MQQGEVAVLKPAGCVGIPKDLSLFALDPPRQSGDEVHGENRGDFTWLVEEATQFILHI